MRFGFWLIFAGAAGCQSDDDAAGLDTTDPTQRAAVGTAGGAFISLVFDETEVIAYVCDGTETAATTARWLCGSVVEGTFELEQGDISLVGSVGDEGVDVGLTAAGVETDLFAPDVFDETGLFAGVGEDEDGTELFAGWIVDPSAEQRGAALVTTNGTTTTEPIPTLSSDVVAAGADSIMVIAFSHQAVVNVARIVSPRDPIVSPR